MTSSDHPPDASRGSVDTRCRIYFGAMGLGKGGLADMQGASALSPKGRGNTLLTFEDTSEAGPGSHESATDVAKRSDPLDVDVLPWPKG